MLQQRAQGFGPKGLPKPVRSKPRARQKACDPRLLDAIRASALQRRAESEHALRQTKGRSRPD
jgi:hypothetical protein